MSANDHPAAKTLDAEGMDILFREAHTYNAFRDEPVTEETLRAVYDLMKWGPTSANTLPLRVVFVRTKEGKGLLAPAIAPNNVAKTMAAPVVAILAYDTQFAESVPRLFPAVPGAAAWFADPAMAAKTAIQGSHLQAAYLIVAARAYGLGCGPMAGFDAGKVDAAFFPDGRFKSILVMNMGYPAPGGHYPRGPRLAFEEVCSFK
jgi:3-hydroxypropanoate dehydrogenase